MINDNKPRIVADARRNELTRHNPSIVGMGIVAWAGYPLRSIEGHVLGTCCVVDTVVRDWTTEEKRSSKGSGRDAPTLYVERASATGWSAGTS